MITIGLGEYCISGDADESIITHALGSCVAFIVHCRRNRKTAMAHIVLPSIDRTDQMDYLKLRPAYFANVAVPRILDEYLEKMGCTKQELQIILVGGASSTNRMDMFRVGNRNVEAVLGVLKEYNVKPVWTDVGGCYSRTVEVRVTDGEVTIRSQKMVI